MKYETKNNVGIILAILGSISAIVGFLLFEIGTLGSWIMLGGGILCALLGFYWLTRGFTAVDQDHPDYHRWHKKDETTRP